MIPSQIIRCTTQRKFKKDGVFYGLWRGSEIFPEKKKKFFSGCQLKIFLSKKIKIPVKDEELVSVFSVFCN